MSELRWTDPKSNAPRRLKAALEAYEAEPSQAARERGWAKFREAQADFQAAAPSPRRTFAFAGVGLVAAAVCAVWVILGSHGGPLDPEASLVASASGKARESEASRSSAPESERTEQEIAAAEASFPDVPAPEGLEDWKVVKTSAGDVLRIHADAQVEVHDTPHVAIELTSGIIDVEAFPRGSGAPLVVAAEPWRVVVVGTRFTVERWSDAQIRVKVKEGKVRVVGPGHKKLLLPGDTFDVRPTLTGRGERRRRRAPSRLDKRVEPQTPAPEAAAASAAEEQAASAAEEQAAWLAKAKRADTLDTRVKALDRAADLDAPLAEIAAYRAASALYDAGRYSVAEKRYAAMLVRWPNGQLTEMAHLDRIECLLAVGKASEARLAVQLLLRAFPAAESRPELSFARAEIARALGEFEVAARLYAQSARTARFAEPASFLEALSYARAGDLSQAREKMQAYLARFPKGRHAGQARRALQDNGN